MVQKTPPQRISRLSPNNPSLPASARWQAVVNRDATANTFVYAVLTTRIYCRPSCPARLARRANVKFYDTPSQAEAAGFRSCKRCKPETIRAVNPQTQLIENACETILSDIRAGSKPRLQKLADEACLTPSHFHRVFKRVMGVTPGQYAQEVLNKNSQQSLDQNSGQDGNNGSIFSMTAVADGVDLDNPGSSGGLGDIYTNAGGSMPWNEFDILITAEDEQEQEHVSGEDRGYLDNLFLPLMDHSLSAPRNDIPTGPLVEKAKQSITQSEMIDFDEALITLQPWEGL
ncbi:hypothetical protein AWENTII_003828 [Aspergillus wentii]|nr:hypothetical protein MW887_007052 [Aspergillus wentii]